MSEPAWCHDVVIPALLRHARNTYGVAMRRALVEAGFEDVPRNGLYVIGGLALGAGGVPLRQLVRELRISKQAAGQLIDTLVERGYLDRAVDPADRRRLNIPHSARFRRGGGSGDRARTHRHAARQSRRSRGRDRVAPRLGGVDRDRPGGRSS